MSGKQSGLSQTNQNNRRLKNKSVKDWIFFISKQYDLIVLISLAFLLPLIGLLPVTFIRIPVGLVTVLIAPGYALMAALFPQTNILEPLVRTALSFGLSLASLPLFALILSALPWRIQLWSATLILALWILVTSTIAGFRRWSLSCDNDFNLPAKPGFFNWWSQQHWFIKNFYISGSLLVFGVIAFGFSTLIIPNQAQKLTEFYALGATGLAEDYPREVALGQNMQVTLGIMNREGLTGHYRIEVRTQDKLLASSNQITLEADGKWEQPLSYHLDKAGDDQIVEFLLFYENKLIPYRQLKLLVNVKERGST